MKKQISLCLALALAFSLAACGGTEAAKSGETSSPAAADTAAEDADTEGNDARTQAEEPEAAPAPELAYGAAMEEQTVLDNEYIKLTATGMQLGTREESEDRAYRNADGTGGAIEVDRVDMPYLFIDFTVENVADVAYEVQMLNLAADGCRLGMTTLYSEPDSYGLATFEPGKTAEACAPISETYLEKYGIETISDFRFIVSLYDRENRKYIYTSEPCILTTSAYGEYTHAFTPEGETVYDEGGITVTLGEAAFDETFISSGNLQYLIPICITNKSEGPIYLCTKNDAINGKQYDRSLYVDVLEAGTCYEPQYMVMNQETFSDENVDTYELTFDLEISRVTETDGRYANSVEPLGAVSGLTVTFDDSAAKAAWEEMPTSEEEAKAQFEANS